MQLADDEASAARFVRRALGQPGQLVACNATVELAPGRYRRRHHLVYSRLLPWITYVEWQRYQPCCRVCGRRVAYSEPCLLIALRCVTCFGCYYATRVSALLEWLYVARQLVQKHLVLDVCMSLDPLLSYHLFVSVIQDESVICVSNGSRERIYPLMQLIELDLHRFFHTGFRVKWPFKRMLAVEPCARAIRDWHYSGARECWVRRARRADAIHELVNRFGLLVDCLYMWQASCALLPYDKKYS